MDCQKDIAEKIRSRESDFLLSVKGNQGRLNKAFKENFLLKELDNPKYDSYSTSEKVTGERKTGFILSAISRMN